MAETLVQTRVLFFGRLGEQLGRERLVEIPGGCTIGDLRRRLAAEDETLASLASEGVRASLDQRIVTDCAKVVAGQEIAFFSPLSGG